MLPLIGRLADVWHGFDLDQARERVDALTDAGFAYLTVGWRFPRADRGALARNEL